MSKKIDIEYEILNRLDHYEKTKENTWTLVDRAELSDTTSIYRFHIIKSEDVKTSSRIIWNKTVYMPLVRCGIYFAVILLFPAIQWNKKRLKSLPER